VKPNDSLEPSNHSTIVSRQKKSPSPQEISSEYGISLTLPNKNQFLKPFETKHSEMYLNQSLNKIRHSTQNVMDHNVEKKNYTMYCKIDLG
jgi:hypothetical protein